MSVKESFDYIPAFLRPLAPYFSKRAEKEISHLSPIGLEMLKEDSADISDLAAHQNGMTNILFPPALFGMLALTAATGGSAVPVICLLGVFAAAEVMTAAEYSIGQITLNEIDKKQKMPAQQPS